MFKRLTLVLVVAILFAGLLSTSVFAKHRVMDKRLEKMSEYSFMFKPQMKMVGGERSDGVTSSRPGEPISLSSFAGLSPGEQVGFTYYDYQQNSTMGRLVDWRGGPQIHFAWTFGPSVDIDNDRTIAYNVYDPGSGTWPLGKGIGCAIVDPNEIRAGFVNLDVRPPDPGNTDEFPSAVYGAHVAPGTAATGFRTQVYWDQATASLGFCDWTATNRVSDSLNDLWSTDQVIWPKIEYHINGSDTVTYACSYGGGGVDAIVVYRAAGQIGDDNTTSWTAHFIDSCFFIVQDITASRVSGKVAVVYTTATNGDPASSDGERDVTYKESTDMGLTWGSRINVTNYNDAQPGHRAWLEVSALYDSFDNLHIVWNANVYTPAGGANGRDCRLFHWADHTGVISTVHNAEWPATDADCNMGVNTLNVAKFNISECDSNLYVIWSQANDPPNGLTDDCADPNVIAPAGGGNADIYVSVSSNMDGLSWDAARNLTNSYTPNCDTVAGEECENDNWGSMSRYGMDNTDFGALDFGNATLATTVDPDPDGYSGTHYLDVFYVNDLAPGGSPNNEVFTRDPLRWFRLPCVDPVTAANANLSPSTILYPFYLQHGQDSVIKVVVENSGNAAMTTTSVTKVEDSGPPGWLAFTPNSFNINFGIDNKDTLFVTLNAGGIVNSPGTIVNLRGWVILRLAAPAVRDSVSLRIDFPVADTLVGITWDTLATACTRLVLSSHGNMGDAGAGGVNFDYTFFGSECDTGAGILGDEDVYLYDGSPIIFNNADTTASWSIFGAGLSSENTFKPIADVDLPEPGVFSGDNFEAYWSGKFTTVDSSLILEKTMYAPTAVDSCNFMVQAICIYSPDGSPVSGITVGEAWDWDIPSDTGVQNIAGSDPINGIVWLQGSEYNEDNDSECQNNNARFGGVGFIGFTDGANPTLNDDPPANIYTALNETYVLPAGGFVPSELFENMQSIGGVSVVPPTTIDDQHMVMTVNKNYSLAANDTLVVWIAMATIRNGLEVDFKNSIIAARNWFNANPDLPKRPNVGCCVGSTGNVNGDVNDVVDISDLTKLVNNLFVTFEPIPCPAEANTNGDANCTVDISDLTKLVNNLFVTFEPLAPCLPACQ